MYYYNGSVYVEDDDQCQTCFNFAQGVACPLLQALGMGMVVLQDSMVVTNCGFYKEFKRNLRIVPSPEKPKDGDDENPDNKIRKFK